MKKPKLTLDLKPGDIVDYSPVIGRPPTMFGLVVAYGPVLLSGHTWVVWLKGKSGAVAVEACSKGIGQ